MSTDSVSRNFLKTLVPCEDANIDIVAVHGLNPKDKEFHAEETWKSGDKLWLRDFLPEQLPRARILLFGYNSNVGFQSSAAGVREQAINLLNRLWLERQGVEVRPLIFIAHSLGGIVVKEALVQAKLGEKYFSICAATYGIAFFGTPHRGSPFARFGAIIAKITRTILRNPSNTFMTALKQNELYASELFSNFQQLVKSYQFLSFYETRSFKNLGLVVDKTSATLNLPDSRETQIALDADHKNICKFASALDENYKQVSRNIVHMANCATKAFEEQSLETNGAILKTADPLPEAERSIFMIPYSRNPDFVGRNEILHQLKDRSKSIGEAHSRVALFGLGGVGKSHIAIQFAYLLRESRPEVSVFWIHASSPDRIYEGFRKIAHECDIPGAEDEDEDVLSLVKTWLESTSQRWLLIIDNADDMSLFLPSNTTYQGKDSSIPFEPTLCISDYLPECSQGSILITTRNRAAAVAFNGGRPRDLIEVKPMTELESTDLIKSKLTNDSSHHSESEINELADLLDHLPLALVQAAAFMQQNMISVSEYLALLKDGEETQMDLLCEAFQTLGRDSQVPNAVATTMMLSINQIKGKQPRAIEILSLMAFLDRQEIPKEFVQKKQDRILDLTKALGVLKAFSLIAEGQTPGTYSLHRLVQLVVRKWLILEGQDREYAEKALEKVDALFPDAEFENWKICAAYLPHAQSVLEFTQNAEGQNLRNRIHLQAGIAYYMWSQGRYKEAEELDIQVLEAKKKEVGLEHMETVECMSYLASTYADQGRWAEAEELDRQVVELRKKLLGPEHPDTLTSISVLAKTYMHLGRLGEAETLAADVLEKTKNRLGSSHLDTLTDMNVLASIYIDQEQWGKAEELCLHVCRLRQEKLGIEHPDTLTTMYLLAIINAGTGRYGEAEKLALQVVKGREKQYGPTHHLTLDAKGRLASIYGNLGKWKEAEILTRQVLDGRMEQLGPSHPDTLTTKANLAILYSNQDLLDQAEELEVEVVEQEKHILEPDDPSRLVTVSNLAWTRKRKGQHAEAVELMEEVVRLRTKRLGSDHPDTKDAAMTLDVWRLEEECLG
ncbi:hypothetical protein VTN96DRAFT_7204 [Rasamsonia emersonii]